MATYKIRQGQTLFDLAVQLYGDVSKVYEIIKLNPTTIPNILTRNLSGLTINYDLQNNEVANRFATDGTILTSQYPEFITAASAWSVIFSSPFTTPPTA